MYTPSPHTDQIILVFTGLIASAIGGLMKTGDIPTQRFFLPGVLIMLWETLEEEVSTSPAIKIAMKIHSCGSGSSTYWVAPSIFPTAIVLTTS